MFSRPWPEPAVASAWLVEVDRPALVLGSTQPGAAVDRSRAAAADVEVVRRRSGGGAVLLRPGEVLWADVLVPAGHRLHQADVGHAFHWLGRTWAGALAAVGVEAEPHEGRPVPSRWSDRVCFAGVGPGEVTVGGAKVVGMSQRRTRAGALFQCGALLVWDPGPLLDLLALDDAERAAGRRDLTGVAAGAPATAGQLRAAFLDALASA